MRTIAALLALLDVVATGLLAIAGPILGIALLALVLTADRWLIYAIGGPLILWVLWMVRPTKNP